MEEVVTEEKEEEANISAGAGQVVGDKVVGFDGDTVVLGGNKASPRSNISTDSIESVMDVRT